MLGKRRNVMGWDQTITIIASILVPMLAGFGWMFHKIGRVEERLNQVDQRLSRLEGAFEERGRWESRKISGDK
jgi:hypothetical protein